MDESLLEQNNSIDCSEKRLLIDNHLTLAQVIASKLFKNRCDDLNEFDDYYHFAVIGLIEASEKYDKSNGIPFESYAKYRIKGAVLNGIQSSSEKSEQIAFKKRILKERAASIKDRSHTTDSNNLLFDDLVEIAIEFAISYMLEDGGLLNDQSKVSNDTLYKSLAFDELKSELNNVVQKLPDRERTIIHYHYYHGMRFTAIAHLLGITKGRVSQIHKHAIDMIKERYDTNGKLDDYI